MKKLMVTVAVSATFLLVQACSPSAKSSSTLVAAPDPKVDPHAKHDMGNMEMPEAAKPSQAELTVPKTITPKTPVPLVIDIQDPSGNAVTSFDRFQEKLMHLIAVSDDLQFFSHLHPDYKGNGRFEVTASFPQPSRYTLFSDYKPSGEEEQVSLLKTQIPGTSSPTPANDLNRTKTFAETKANLTFSEPTLKAGKEVMLKFELKQTSNNQPLTDLQPYLGQRGHLVILRQASNLTAADYIHAHAMKDTPTDQVNFMTTFPQPGKYKLWGQFNRNGKVITTDFWVEVI